MDFGAWQPDLPPHGHNGLTEATNVYATALGYAPVQGPSALTTALAYDWQGGGGFRGLDGTTARLAGTDNGFYSWASSAWTLKLSGTYTAQWFFAQFGDNVIGVNGAAPVKYTISTATGATLGGSPPNSTMIAIVRDFVFLAGDSSALSTVTWSAINNSEGWTAGTNQSDVQQLPDGGPITGLAGGEYGLVFQEAAVHRFSYVGGDLIFQRDKIVEGVGNVSPGAVAQFGRITFFLSSRGFYSLADGELIAIGKNKVDKTFWAEYTRADVDGTITSTVDPTRAVVMWAMPGKIWKYNWELDRWSITEIPGLVGVSTGVNASVSLEDIDTLYPDTGSGNIDAVPYSLDAPIFKGGEPMVILAKTDKIVYALGGANLSATLTMANNEIVPGRDTRIRAARIVGDVVSGAQLTINFSRRLGDAQSVATGGSIRDSGRIPIRLTGRFMQPKIIQPAGTDWDYIQGLELELAGGGKR